MIGEDGAGSLRATITELDRLDLIIVLGLQDR